MVEILDHYQRANALLASQFRDTLPDQEKNNFQKLLKAMIDSMQEIDNQNQALIFERFLDTAMGVNLDGIGEIVGLARVPGQNDEDYREDIKFQIFVNRSNGTPEEMISILKYLTDAQKIWYYEMFPGGFQMATDGLTYPTPWENLVTAINKASPAGVNYVPIAALVAWDPINEILFRTVPFTFSGDPIEELLWVAPDPNDPLDLHNLEVDTGELIEVNAGATENPTFGGWFAEVDALNNLLSNPQAGQLAELIQIEN